MLTNILYCGDNLEIMRSLPDASIDLIYADPPFNTGKDWGEFDDRWDGGLDGYLAFMKPRLERMRELLKDTGSLYLHCDPTASHYLKVLLDTIFGIKQFRNEIVWCYRNWVSHRDNYANTHDLIFFYTKTDIWKWNQLYQPKSESTIQRFGKNKISTINSEKGKLINIAIGEHSEVCLHNVWNISIIAGYGKERTGYPTQKPVALLDRIVQASSNAGEIVLDPFCE